MNLATIDHTSRDTTTTLDPGVDDPVDWPMLVGGSLAGRRVR